MIKQVWQTEDGKVHSTEYAAQLHEQGVQLGNKAEVDRFLNTYNGKELLKKHHLSEVGYWEVKGEDPNCDLGGHHMQPSLGVYKGELANVIAKGVALAGFWQWGYGGDFIKCNVSEV